jgi:CRP/FNR family transcriptional regulator
MHTITDSSLIDKALPMISDPELKGIILREGVLMKFQDEDIIIDQGMPISHVPVVADGTVRVSRQDDEGHEILLYYLSSGDSCASSMNCCVANRMSEIQAIAEGDVTLIGIPQKYIDEWMMEYPEWKNLVIQTFQRRFDDLIHSLEMVAFNQLDDRLIEYLRSKSEVLGTEILKTSHQEIANHLNSSREVISRLLKQLEKLGRVKLSRNTIELIDL